MPLMFIEFIQSRLPLLRKCSCTTNSSSRHQQNKFILNFDYYRDTRIFVGLVFVYSIKLYVKYILRYWRSFHLFASKINYFFFFSFDTLNDCHIQLIGNLQKNLYISLRQIFALNDICRLVH